MHKFLIGFALWMSLMFQWDSWDGSRGRDRAHRTEHRATASDQTNLTTMDGGSGIPPRPPKP